jgi:ABC-type transport system substrate-binding protein
MSLEEVHMGSSSYWSKMLNARLSRRRALLQSSAGTAGAGLLIACGGDDSNNGGVGGDTPTSELITPAEDKTDDAKRGGAYKLSWGQDFLTLDPQTTSAPSRYAVQWTYSKFLSVKPGYKQDPDGEIMGDLADSWEFSPDRLTLTLKLRADVKFAPVPPVNGRAMNVDDIGFSWRRWSEQGTERATLINSINPNAPIESLSTPDARTVVLKLKEPTAGLIATLANATCGNFFVLPREAEDGFDPRRTPIGTGPYYMSENTPSVRTVYTRNPGYWDDKVGFVDSLETPMLSEYASTLAQFIAGGIYGYSLVGGWFQVRAEDILPTKHQIPQLELMYDTFNTSLGQVIFGWRPEPPNQTPFRDERLRQAFSMAIDRDLFIDVFYNVSKFEAEGIPMQTRWNTALRANEFEGWWLDPKGSDFGPNARNLMFDPNEAKKLVEAVGFPNGFDIDLHATAALTEQNSSVVGMVGEVGMRLREQIYDTVTFNNTFVQKRGDFSGMRFGPKAAGGFTDIGEKLYAEYNSRGTPSMFDGFDPDGKGTFAGDPQMDDLTAKMRTEFETKKRQDLAHELQRYAARRLYGMYFPGGAAGLSLGWPVVRNRNVHKLWLYGAPFLYDWLDGTRAPLSKPA